MYSGLPPPSLRGQNCLGVRILELSCAQNTKTCTPAAPPPLRAQNCLEYAFWNFQAPKTLKRVLPPAPPPPVHQASSGGYPPSPHRASFKKRIFSSFWGGVTHRSWPGGRGGRPRALIPKKGVREGLAWWSGGGPRASVPPLSEPKIAGVRILELSSVQNTQTCTPACPPPSQSPKLLAFWNFQAPKTLKRVLPPATPLLRAPACIL